MKQLSGPELGYEIVEFDPVKMPGRQPTFEGYKLELASTLQKISYEINMEKEEGQLFPGGRREVRLVKKRGQNYYTSSLSFLWQ